MERDKWTIIREPDFPELWVVYDYESRRRGQFETIEAALAFVREHGGDV